MQSCIPFPLNNHVVFRRNMLYLLIMCLDTSSIFLHNLHLIFYVLSFLIFAPFFTLIKNYCISRFMFPSVCIKISIQCIFLTFLCSCCSVSRVSINPSVRFNLDHGNPFVMIRSFFFTCDSNIYSIDIISYAALSSVFFLGFRRFWTPTQ